MKQSRISYSATPDPGIPENGGRGRNNPDEIAITVRFPRRELDLMKRYADLGVERVVFNLEAEASGKVLPVIDEVAEFMHKANA